MQSDIIPYWINQWPHGNSIWNIEIRSLNWKFTKNAKCYDYVKLWYEVSAVIVTCSMEPNYANKII